MVEIENLPFASGSGYTPKPSQRSEAAGFTSSKHPTRHAIERFQNTIRPTKNVFRGGDASAPSGRWE
jgi:hypothetical protein